MNFAAFLLFVTQIGLASFCVFQREDVLKMGASIVFASGITEAACFAECLNTKRCTRLCYNAKNRQCYLYPEGEDELVFKPNASRTCYSLHREQMKAPQYTRIMTFTRKNSIWVA